MSLRIRTRDAHDAAEAGFEARLAFRDREAYVATLRSLQRWYALVEQLLMDAGQPPGDWQRAHLIVADLAELGEADAGCIPATATAVVLPAALGPAEVAGWLYVLVGSALGGRVLARLAVGLLGPATPVSFFGTSHVDVGALWRDLSATQDAAARVAVDQEKYTDSAVHAARSAFGSFRQIVRWGGQTPVQ